MFLDKFLFKYRLTPHAATAVSPSELLFKRRLPCRLDLLFPSDQVETKVAHKQEMQRNSRNSKRSINLAPGDLISVRNYAMGPSWIPAEVSRQTGPVSYECKLPDGQTRRRHQDQIYPVDHPPVQSEDSSIGDVIPSDIVTKELAPAVPGSPIVASLPSVKLAAPEARASPKQTLRRSGRARRPVDRLNL